MSAAFVIMSGSYVGAELVAEFGMLPPSLLPNGGRPLYHAQCDMADALGAAIILVLPDGYVLPDFDAEHLAARGAAVVFGPPDALVLDSLRAGLAAADDPDEVYLLFGDTLVPDRRDWPTDGFAAGTTDHVAIWAEYREHQDGCSFRQHRPEQKGAYAVVAGFFHFADVALLTGAADAAGDIVGLLNGYSAIRRMVPVIDADWLDFGHLFTYHQSRCRELLARSFNTVISDGHSVVKTGTPARKIYAEAEWYRQLPAQLRPFAPQFMGNTTDKYSYEIEYLYLPLLSELYTFAHLPPASWGTILESCRSFLTTIQSIRPPSHLVPENYPKLFFDEMIGNKTTARLHHFARARGLAYDMPWTFNGERYRSLGELARLLTAMIRPTTTADICHWHGDFHFGNIFYDFRARKVRTVDPRGLLPNGMLTIYGDARYDIAKLGHSVFGCYDLLIADRYHLRYDGRYDVQLDFGDDDGRDAIIAAYTRTAIGDYEPFDQEAIAMVALLFLSMLPLHAKDGRRQMAILANAMRLARMAEAAHGGMAQAAE